MLSINTTGEVNGNTVEQNELNKLKDNSGTRLNK